MTTSTEEAVTLDRTLTGLVRRVNRHGGQLPEGVVPAVHEVEDELRPLLDYLRTHAAGELEVAPVRSLVNDYFPTTMDRFLGLPSSFITRHRSRNGLTPTQELLGQLRLLAEGARECADAIYAGDAQLITNQSHFLQSKFTRSELDLGAMP